MFSLGHDFVPAPIHAGGLRYHGMAPLVSQTIVEGLVEPQAIDQLTCYKSALTWAQTEGTICAPETSHAVASVINEAVRAREEAKEKVILFCYSGHGLMDLSGYDKYLSGELSELRLTEQDIEKYLEPLGSLPKPEKKKSGRW
jgi:tryptophan synthase beta chain